MLLCWRKFPNLCSASTTDGLRERENWNPSKNYGYIMRLNVFNLVNNKEQAQLWRQGACLWRPLPSFRASGFMGCAFPACLGSGVSLLAFPVFSFSVPGVPGVTWQ